MTTVVAAIVERDGQVLICQRKNNEPNHPLKWEFPGGKVEPAEEPTAALRRELQEELAIEAVIGPEVERYEYRYPGRKPILLIFFRVSAFEREPRNVVFEQIRWERRERLPDYDFLEGDVDFVRRLAG